MTVVTESGRLKELADRMELQALLNRQGLWLDERRFDDACDVFTDDVTVETPGGRAAGIEAVAAQARRVHTRFPRTQHVTTNVLVELDGDRATVAANLIVAFSGDPSAPDAEPPVLLGERYHFEAVRTSRGWRFAGLRVTPVWRSGDLPPLGAPPVSAGG